MCLFQWMSKQFDILIHTIDQKVSVNDPSSLAVLASESVLKITTSILYSMFVLGL